MRSEAVEKMVAACRASAAGMARLETSIQATPVVALADGLTTGGVVAHAARLAHGWAFPILKEADWPVLDAVYNAIIAGWLPNALDPDPAALPAMLHATHAGAAAAHEAARTNTNTDARAIANAGVAIIILYAIELRVYRAAQRFIARETLARVGSEALALPESTANEPASAV